MRWTAKLDCFKQAIFQAQFRVMQLVMVALILGARAQAEGHPAESRQPAPAAPSSDAGRRIVVSLPDCKLALIENDQVVRVYSVAVGAGISPTPVGQFRIVRRVTNPTYYHPGVVVPAGHANPLGPRWIGLDVKGYGIHGTNEPGSIGHRASHGCIRMRNRDVKELFALVREGDTVELHGVRDAETTRLFREDTEIATNSANDAHEPVAAFATSQATR